MIHPLRVTGHHILRYNSRGVGKSTGWPSLTGFREGEDLDGVVRWVMGKFPTLISLVLIVSATLCSHQMRDIVDSFQGYSHGSLIASVQQMLPPPVKTAHVLLSYPLGPRGWLTMFHSNSYTTKLVELVHDENSNVLVIFGDEDEFTSVSKYRIWGEQLQGDTNGRLELVEITGGTHFWRGEAGEQLESVVQGWLP